MKRTRRNVWKMLAALPLLALGCKEELGPEPMPTTRVVGRVHVRSQPVPGGWIEFLPHQGTVGLLCRSAPIRPDGSFVCEKVAVGLNAIQISHPPLAILVTPAVRHFTQVALIRRTIDTVPETKIDIDLEDEYLIFLHDHPPTAVP